MPVAADTIGLPCGGRGALVHDGHWTELRFRTIARVFIVSAALTGMVSLWPCAGFT